MKPGMKFDIVEAIREALHAELFSPFRLRLHSGEQLRISNPDVLTVTLSGRVIYDEGRGVRMLNPVLIASVDFPNPRKR